MPISSYSEYQKLVEQHHGKSKQFEQGTYLALNKFDPDVVNGVCRSLSAAFILRNFLRGLKADEDIDHWDMNSDALDDHYGRLKFFSAFQTHDRLTHATLGPRGEKDARRFETIALVQKRYAREGMLQEGDLVEAADKTVAALSEGNMQYKGHVTVTFPGGIKKELFDVTPGYWLISAGKHMMAVSVRRIGSRVKFFDSNRGQARFDGTDDLVPFLQAYLTDQGYHPFFLIRYG